MTRTAEPPLWPQRRRAGVGSLSHHLGDMALREDRDRQKAEGLSSLVVYRKGVFRSLIHSGETRAKPRGTPEPVAMNRRIRKQQFVEAVSSH